MIEGLTRAQLADAILERMLEVKEELANQFRSNKVNTCFVDDVLPKDIVIYIHNSFPEITELVHNKSIRENKYVGVQMDKYPKIIEEITYAFQDSRILELVAEITGLKEMYPDEHLYAGGISLMGRDNFLNPHLDNSHDKDRQNYRVLNLLYYVTPDWKEEYGGNLEVWDNGPKQKQRTIVSKFNRLAIMITNKTSWHSVSKVVVDKKRCCVSNYYFSPIPTDSDNYFHVTSFRGRPEEKLKDIVLQGDAAARNAIRKILPSGVKETTHVYQKKDETK